MFILTWFIFDNQFGRRFIVYTAVAKLRNAHAKSLKLYSTFILLLVSSMALRYVTVWYASIFAKKYGTLIIGVARGGPRKPGVPPN